MPSNALHPWWICTWHSEFEKNTSFIVFSNFSINQSLKDDFRYPYDYWGDWKTNYR